MDTLADIIEKKDDIINTFNLTKEDFEHMIYWFKNEMSLDDSKADDPALVLKNPAKSYKGCTSKSDDDKGNTTWVTNRFSSALEYARSQGKKQSSK